MFTGIIEAQGEIKSLQAGTGGSRLVIASGGLALDDVALGDSIAVDGVCLTVVAFSESQFEVDVSAESLRCTTLGMLAPGRKINLEKALLPTTRLGGHLVSGHVDGVGEIVARHNEGEAIRFRLRAPAELAKYIATKGSVTVDGVSLTVNGVAGSEFELTIVPHTASVTTVGGYVVGRKVNLEVDLIARYLERLVLGDKAAEVASSLTPEFLAQHGFLNR